MKNPNDLKVTSGDAPEQETGPVNAMQEKLDQKPAELQTTLDMNEDGKVVQETLDKIKASGKAVFVIYRSNSIYKDLGPAIVQQLEGHGIPFTLQAFPAGTDKKEIEQRINDNIPEEQEGIYMSDQTCGSHKSSDMMDIYMDEICDKFTIYSYQKKLIGAEFKRLFNKDLPKMNDEQYKKSLFNKALEKLKQKGHKETDEDRKALRTTIRKDLDKDERVAYMKANNIGHYGHSGFKDMFPLLLDECFSQKKPSKIVIMVKCINDHFTTEGRSALIGKEVADGLSKDEGEKQTAQALAELIKKNTSFTGEVIIRSPYEFSSNEDDENTRYINDRHNEALSVSNATILRLPCINMIEDMAKYNLSEATAPDTESLTNYAFLDINETIEQAIEFEMW